ncbi:hypothetical protein A2382_00440 [Candidatus Woesebacteria bacterium RIFOXYB1_FULL_38_16]|uniref:Glycosyltransferase RgtA/B/C/D-like domain-containing protein n=1 Tax=Candidatus Woesebacteria bacterium RIFOXYB1_FULL_38_16 TaxID=1802538 RepID=A0A1F8CU19_9BACT|nr:MAG: hypothetical protein A2191_01320 [Candidatus Woesebacteria bacterium RIFOXYA1_FULL_38_9]OGM79238.1 MAG: hypothetical protein A2382_00440 [Candidatus Woesebacteria bacterium RIFOXYB1_FULL_38_16]
MKKIINKIKKDLLKEVGRHKVVYFCLGIILLAGLIARVYRVGTVLGFYYDQGRDALVIWELIHKGKLFLIGPTTGIAGIFRGPFYYYLIAPFYFVGGGDPAWPAVMLAVLSVLAIALMYYLALKMQDRISGLFAALIASLSFYIVMAGRWLSNPTPMLLLSMILVWLMVLVTEGKKWAWVGIAFVAGSSLFHFGSAGEAFYFPALLLFAIWQRKNLPGRKIFVLSLVAFLITAMPQIVFDIRHDGILRENIKKFLIDDGSFKLSFRQVLEKRLDFYYDVFTNKIFHWRRKKEVVMLAVVGLTFLVCLPKFIKQKGVVILMLLLTTLMVGLLFFQGNFGNIYDYYLTGYYLVFILLFGLVLGRIWRFWLGKIFVIFFFWNFFAMNINIIRFKITDNVDGPGSVALKNELQAIDWVYRDAAGRPFNIDVYVPPVIPYAYDYLIKWYGMKNFGYLPEEKQISLLYTIYENDNPHPERLEAWFERQKGIGDVVDEVRFGGIGVQRRVRKE